MRFRYARNVTDSRALPELFTNFHKGTYTACKTTSYRLLLVVLYQLRESDHSRHGSQTVRSDNVDGKMAVPVSIVSFAWKD